LPPLPAGGSHSACRCSRRAPGGRGCIPRRNRSPAATQRRLIASLAAALAPLRYAFDPSLGALVCVLLLLKTKAVIEHDKAGRWHFKAELIELKQGPLGVVLNLFAKLAKKS
jgi:hypothetical protein